MPRNVFFYLLISSPEHKVLMVSYCGQSMSVVHYAASTIALKAYSSYTPGPIDSILGRKHRGDLKIKNSWTRSDWKSKMTAMAAILKIYFSLLLLNPPWRPSWKSIFRFFSWTQKPIDSNLVGSIGVTYRSKIAKIIPIGNPRWWPSWKSIFASSSELKSQLTGNLAESIGMTWSKVAKIVPIGNPRWLPWRPSWKSIFHFISLIKRLIDFKLGRKHRGDL